MKILFSNLGYAKGISGSFTHHVMYGYRHFYHPAHKQQAVLEQFRSLLINTAPDICCMVELDSGSRSSGYLNQLSGLMCKDYCHGDIAGKYGEDRWINHLPFHRGKSNGFIARQDFTFERHYFPYGSKRLMHQLRLADDIILIFTHFSLRHTTRTKQLTYISEHIKKLDSQVILLADFNILRGMNELMPLMQEAKLVMPPEQTMPTFRFLRRLSMLDVCLCSAQLAEKVKVDVIPQPFSDHAALLVTCN